jgi:trans-aconitate methyltransferase
MAQQWNADLYQQSHSFVWESGSDLLGLLAPKAGERILDVGCGTGQLTAEIARSGAETIGIDSSAAMIAQARSNFPSLRFEVQDVRALAYEGEFDAVFSNAVLHWVQPADAAAAAIARALKPGGRFVAEFGGRGNVAEIVRAAEAAWPSVAGGTALAHPWYYPGIAEYASVLEQSGLEVTFAVLFDRPTPLEGGSAGLSRWYEMFGAHWIAPLGPDRRAAFFAAAERIAAPKLQRDGSWNADYRRLRIVARK